MKGQAGGVKEQTWAKGETHPNSSRFFSNSIWQYNIIAVISAKSVNLYFYPGSRLFSERNKIPLKVCIPLIISS